jgi:hypothetical protein
MFEGIRKRRAARQKRKSQRQRARQKRKQTRAEGRFSPEAVAARQGMISDLGGQALGIAGGLLGADSAMAEYSGQEPMPARMDYGPVDDGGGMDPMMLAVGAVAVVGLLLVVMKK